MQITTVAEQIKAQMIILQVQIKITVQATLVVTAALITAIVMQVLKVMKSTLTFKIFRTGLKLLA